MSIKIEGMKKLEKKLGSLADLNRQFVAPTMEEAAHYVLSQVPDYPPQQHKKQPFVSARQRRYVMAAIKRGDISTPYRRTGTLGRSITTEVRTIGGSVQGVIGTNTTYAPWVISDEETPDGIGPQSHYHEGNWWTLQGVVRGAIPEVYDIFNTRLGEFLAKK